MEFLALTGRSFQLPATNKFVMQEWLDQANKHQTDLLISSLTGYGGEDWTNLVEEGIAPIAVVEYKLAKSCKYRYAVRDLGEMSRVCLTFAQVLAFLQLAGHTPGNHFQFYVGNCKNRHPRWDLTAELIKFSNGAKKWSLDLDFHFDHSDRWLGPNIIAPA